MKKFGEGKKDLNKRYVVLKGENGEDIIVKRPLKERFDAWVQEHPAAEKVILGSLIGLGVVGGYAVGSAVEKRKAPERAVENLIEDGHDVTVDLDENNTLTVEAVPSEA